jgi:hypothetical protein
MDAKRTKREKSSKIGCVERQLELWGEASIMHAFLRSQGCQKKRPWPFLFCGINRILLCIDGPYDTS